MNTQTYTVNIRTGVVNITRVDVSQGDTGRTLVFKLYDGLSPFTPPTGSTVTIVGRKPSKLGFSEACTVSGNVATVTTTLAMTQEAGKFPVELRIEANGESIGTANFTMYIEPSPHPDGTTDGTHATVDNLQAQIGNLANLTTTAKTNLVSAINEAAQSGSEVIIDDTLTQTGQAADAKKTGDEISAIKADLGDLSELETEDKTDLVSAINEVKNSDVNKLPADFIELLQTVLTEAIYGSDQTANIDALSAYASEASYYNVSRTLTNCISSNESDRVLEGASYTTNISAKTGYTLKSVSCTMGGVQQTVINGEISIPSVTGNIVIVAIAEISPTGLLYELTTPTIFDGTNIIDTETSLDGNYSTDNSLEFTIACETTCISTGDNYVFSVYSTALSAGAVYVDLFNKNSAYVTWFGERKNKGIGSWDNDDVIRIVYRKKAGELPTISVSINGGSVNVINSSTTASGAILLNDNVFIGCSPSKAANTMLHGTLTDFRIYERAFTDTEVTAYLVG